MLDGLITRFLISLRWKPTNRIRTEEEFQRAVKKERIRISECHRCGNTGLTDDGDWCSCPAARHFRELEGDEYPSRVAMSGSRSFLR